MASPSLPVPGFGFMSRQARDYIENTFQDILDQDIETVNMTVEETDELKCKLIVMQDWKIIFPHLSQYEDQSICLPFWDNASCIPPTVAGNTAILPCMQQFNGEKYSASFNASRYCSDYGVWSPTTYYGDCLCNCTADTEGTTALEISIIIYLVGYVLSFLALCGALTIYLSFREMRCLRHKIHMGLFCAFGLSALNWIFTKSLQSDITTFEMTMSEQIYCTSWVLTYFFHMASFYWMFIEGLYLFLQVQYPLSLVNIKYKHFIIIGCGGPVLNLLLWVALRLHFHDPHQSQTLGLDCPFFEKSPLDVYILQIPLCTILFCNTFFLIWIMVIVVSKLRENTALDHDRKHWKAAKALIIVMPILGIGYLITIEGPTATPWAKDLFQIIRCVLLSTQGLVISLPYCYLNTEVQLVIKTHYKRWQLIRNVGTGQMSNRQGTSVAACTGYTTVNKDQPDQSDQPELQMLAKDGMQMTPQQLLAVPCRNPESSHSSNTDICSEC